jgi:response regulator RpfG family c-di-GMP phosphodiesterase
MKKVLIIEDGTYILSALQSNYKQYNLHLISSLYLFSVNHIATILPDLILHDHYVFGQLGTDFYTQLKEDTRTSNIPVILFSDHNNIQVITKNSNTYHVLPAQFGCTDILNIIAPVGAVA